MVTANPNDSSFYLYVFFFHLCEPPCWMLFPVKVHTIHREGLISSRNFVSEESILIIHFFHTPKIYLRNCKVLKIYT